MTHPSPSRGRLSWVEANTPLCSTVQRFYVDLFCWTIKPVHVSPWGLLPAFHQEEQAFGNVFMAMGLFAQSKWILFHHADIAATIPRVEGIGGTVDNPLQEHAGWSKIATVSDPHGTKINLIELESGPQPHPVPYGTPFASELWTHRPSEVKSFYADLFQGEAVPCDGGFTIVVENESRMHLKDLEGADHPPIWVPYFRSRRIGADERRAITFGAIPRRSKVPLGADGLSSLLVDPAGSSFGLVMDPKD